MEQTDFDRQGNKVELPSLLVIARAGSQQQVPPAQLQQHRPRAVLPRLRGLGMTRVSVEWGIGAGGDKTCELGHLRT